MNKKEYRRSFLKYVGSKYNALSKTQQQVPLSGDCLIETFCGSCILSLNTHYEHYILNDKNPDVIALYKHAIKNPIRLLKEIQALFTKENNTNSRFLALREEFNQKQTSFRKSALFVYINRHGYKGLVRYNKRGQLNTPYGYYKNPKFPVDDYWFFVNKFKHATFTCGSFSKVEVPKNNNVIIYCDPPYVDIPGQKNKSFVGYTPEGFSDKDHQTLNKMASSWRLMNPQSEVYIANHASPLIDVFYHQKCKVITFPVKRVIAGRTDQAKSVDEVLLCY